MKTALIIVDVQYDFLPGGALAIPDGDAIIPIISDLLANHSWSTVCFSADWHPTTHISFAKNHDVQDQQIDVEWCGQVQKQKLWPVHCVAETHGSEIAREVLGAVPTPKVFRKGYNEKLDSYSAFADSFGYESTGLHEHLQQVGVTHVFVVGLAEDYCVYETALAAGKLGYKTQVIRSAVRGLKPLTQLQLEIYKDNNVEYIEDGAAILLNTSMDI